MSKGKALIWVIIILIIVAILAVGGWYVYANYYAKPPARIEVSENQQNIDVKKEQEFTIILVSNPSTGYIWQLDQSYNKNVVNYVGKEFKTSNSDLIGAPGQDFWTFKGINKGNTTLKLTYSRFWEVGLPGTNKQPINTKTFNITVK